jgi:hypothetical protein
VFRRGDSQRHELSSDVLRNGPLVLMHPGKIPRAVG